jgi:hypothetical protein
MRGAVPPLTCSRGSHTVSCMGFSEGKRFRKPCCCFHCLYTSTSSPYIVNVSTAKRYWLLQRHATPSQSSSAFTVFVFHVYTYLYRKHRASWTLQDTVRIEQYALQTRQHTKQAAYTIIIYNTSNNKRRAVTRKFFTMNKPTRRNKWWYTVYFVWILTVYPFF